MSNALDLTASIYRNRSGALAATMDDSNLILPTGRAIALPHAAWTEDDDAELSDLSTPVITALLAAIERADAEAALAAAQREARAAAQADWNARRAERMAERRELNAMVNRELRTFLSRLLAIR